MNPPLKWHGGKHYLAKRIVALMPEHTHYVEPFFGGGSVLLAKDPEGVSEVVNDLDGGLTNFWCVLRDTEEFEKFLRVCEATPFAENLWREATRLIEANNGADDTFLANNPVRRAWMFFISCRQSLAGRMESFTPLSRTRTRRGMNEQASAWLTAVDGLSEVHARLKRVAILNRDALDVIRQQDGPGTLFYLDPPYLPETRADANVYAHEMTREQHHKLLTLICRDVCGKVMISGYVDQMYSDLLKGWTRHTFDLPNNAAGGKKKKRMQEAVWCNF